jgi:hypothetical protein
MRLRPARLLVPALAFVTNAALAQLVPGTRTPANIAEAVDVAQAVVCTLAAADRPMGGLNSPPIGGEGYTPVDGVPDSLARFVAGAPRQKIVQYRGAGGPLWIVYDQVSSRCAIYAFADPAAVETKLLESLSHSLIWKPKKDAGAGIDYAYEWKAEPGRKLLTEISRPHAAGEPLVVVVRPTGR